MAEYTRLQNHLALIRLRNPPVNAISVAVLRGIKEGLQKAVTDHTVKAILICGSNGKFCAGADIHGFSGPRTSSLTLGHVVDEIQTNEKPVVAAIEGVALGGGLELALGCHYRIACAENMQPSYVFTPGEALRNDALQTSVIPWRLPAPARDPRYSWRHHHGQQSLESRRLCKRPVQSLPDMDSIFSETLLKIRKQYPGYLSQEACVQAVQAAVKYPYEVGIKKEEELFMYLQKSGQARALQYAFLAERKATKVITLAILANVLHSMIHCVALCPEQKHSPDNPRVHFVGLCPGSLSSRRHHKFTFSPPAWSLWAGRRTEDYS
ncbi:hypothetical protein MC885_015788 [Smutsia gigantea]|nr:hypothetical protein MC885_015788 [Smutsia gigantea]